MSGNITAVQTGSGWDVDQTGNANLQGDLQPDGSIKLDAKGSAAVAAALKKYFVPGYGVAANGVTDDTAAFNALLATIQASGIPSTIVVGGMVRCDGQVTFANDGQTILSQVPIRITGPSTAQNDGYWRTINSRYATYGFDLRYNAPIAKIITQGNGTLEVDHLLIKNGGTDTSPFIYTTATTLNFHDMTFSGSASFNDAFVFGGSGSINNTINSAFQGYNTVVKNVFFDRIRKGGIFNGAANAIKFLENTISLSCGNPETTAISAATNASQCSFTITGHPWASGDVIRLRVSGFTGNWAPMNGLALSANVIDANTVQLFGPGADSSTYGAMTGSPVFLSGPFLEFAGSANYPTLGCIVAHNLFEMTNYGYFARMDRSGEHIFNSNTLWDTNGSTIAYVLVGANAQSGGGTFFAGFQSGYTPCVVGAGNAGSNKWFVLDHRQDTLTYGVGNYFPAVTTFGKGINIANGEQVIWSAKSKLYSSTDGYFTMWNNAQNGFSGLRFGTSGYTAGFPLLKRNGGHLRLVQADETTASNLEVTGKVYPGTPAGATQQNAGLFGGTGAPVNANGADGDIYFRSDGGTGTTIYQRRAGSWVGIA